MNLNLAVHDVSFVMIFMSALEFSVSGMSVYPCHLLEVV